jgi:hypothetical protein
MKTTKSNKPAALPPAPTTKCSKVSAHPPAPIQKPGKVTRSQIPPAPDIKHGVGYHIRQIVITAFPTILSNEIISATLIASGITGVKASTISTTKMDCLGTLKAAQELGKLIALEPSAIPADAPAALSEPPAEQVVHA